MFASLTDAFGLRFGFRLWDKVKCNHPKSGDIVGYVQGRRSSGSFAIASLDGDLLIGGVSYKKLTLKQPAKSNYIRERRTASSPTDFSTLFHPPLTPPKRGISRGLRRKKRGKRVK